MSTTGRAGRLCGCAAALVLAGCGGGAGDGPAGMPATVVSVEEVRASVSPNLVELPGRVEAVRSAQVRARSDGIVEQQLYVEGTDVTAGAPLFQIDRRDLRARLQQTRCRARLGTGRARPDRRPACAAVDPGATQGGQRAGV